MLFPAGVCKNHKFQSSIQWSCVQVDNYKRVPDPAGFFKVVQELQTPLKTLTINRATVDGRKVAACISPLQHLHCLELVSCYPPTVPESLTSLTRLKLENAGYYCYRDRATSFTGDVSVFSSLQVCFIHLHLDMMLLPRCFLQLQCHSELALL